MGGTGFRFRATKNTAVKLCSLVLVVPVLEQSSVPSKELAQALETKNSYLNSYLYQDLGQNVLTSAFLFCCL